MGLADTKTDIATIKCDKCGSQIDSIREGKIVIADNPQLQTLQGIYHTDCIDPNLSSISVVRIYGLAEYLFQLLEGFGLVEKFEDGDEQRVLLRFPFMVRVK